MANSRTAKLFMNGRSQAVRLPADLRFSGHEVYVRRDPDSGDVVLSARPESWAEFFEIADARVPADFMAQRRDEPPQERKRILA
jgi:antitoxin VapB